MGSTFGGLSIAASGLAAHRRALEVAGGNIANVNTPGYSRQKVDLRSVAQGAAGIHSGSSITGGGVEIASTSRVVDQFVIGRSVAEHAAAGYTAEVDAAFGRIEPLFDEPGEDGLSAKLQSFWDAWGRVEDHPEQESVRAALLQQGTAVADVFGEISRRLDGVAQESISRAGATVADINAATSRIAALNDQISAAIEVGSSPNELMDERDLLVTRLADQLGVTTRTDDRGRMSVTAGGLTLVHPTGHAAISLDASVPGAAVLRLDGSGAVLQGRGGAVPAMLDVANQVVPGQQAKLDAVAVALADAVNAQHALGTDLDGTPGGDVFTATGARDFGLAAGVDGQPRRIAASAAGEGAYGSGNAAAIGRIAAQVGGPDEIFRGMIVELGIAAQDASTRADLQGRIVQQVDAERDAVSGVSLDEEMTNLVAYQQAYQASARFMSAIDEMLERLINGTGSVGR